MPDILEDIHVNVETFWHPDYSGPSEFFFAYRITIQNDSDFSVQLLSRHWHICDGLGQYKEVIGDGVVGEQPIILPGESYQYVSGVGFKTEFGKMFGSYIVRREFDQQLFEVLVPEFIMHTPWMLN
jgi:ApaG protein